MGNPPRALGGILADAYGFDAVAYLDADNWYDPSHIEGLIEAHKAHEKVSLVSCKRRFYDLEGRQLYITELDEETNEHVGYQLLDSFPAGVFAVARLVDAEGAWTRLRSDFSAESGARAVLASRD